ncbi:MAG: Crp/Fnr family transcriptional regulator [Nitrospinae bacterium]|nr:Crp/Fnr family transcriptional regulator [Nitrospinota bacterium]
MSANSISTLKKVTLFSALDEVLLQEVASITTEKLYKKNEVIFHQGDPGSVLFILKSGVVKISLFDQDNNEAILKMLYENDFFGEMSLLDGHFRSATITALETCKALRIKREDFIRLIKEYPSMAFNMLITVSRRLRKADEKIASLTFSDSYGRVAQVLLDLIEKKREEEPSLAHVLALSFSRQELANMAGVSSETFTRILHEFQIRGCLKVEGRNILVLDEAVLKREVI